MSKPESMSPLLDFSIPLFRDSDPLVIQSPVPGQPTAILQFTNLADWRRHVLGLRLRGATPPIFRRKHDQALQLLFMAWLDVTVIKLAELGALATFEGACKARYPNQEFRGLENALKYLIEHEGLVDEAFRVYRETGGAIVQNLLPTSKDGSGSGFSEIRNRLAHGDPFEILPWCGLFEIVRDLIDFMYPAT